MSDGLIFQTSGTKAWQLFEPTVAMPLKGATKRAAERRFGPLIQDTLAVVVSALDASMGPRLISRGIVVVVM